jgi:hypothetical protein
LLDSAQPANSVNPDWMGRQPRPVEAEATTGISVPLFVSELLVRVDLEAVEHPVAL